MAKYGAIRDVQEKNNYWDFPPSSLCTGTVVEHLETGDYTLRGFEKILSIERKYSTGEFAGWVTQKRCDREFLRLEKFAHPFLILEFDYYDLLHFPTNSGIPIRVWPQLKIGPPYLIKRLMEFELNYKTKIIFAGRGGGAERAELIFKYIVQKYGNPPTVIK